jgi:hypothetical protein
MANRKDSVKWIKAGVFSHLNDNYTGNVHWPGIKSPADDDGWIEPWMAVSTASARSRDWLFKFVFTVNVFVKATDSTYTIDELVGEVLSLIRAARVPVTDQADTPVSLGVASFHEPDVTDLGEVTRRGSRVNFRQMNVRCNGTVYPMA